MIDTNNVSELNSPLTDLKIVIIGMGLIGGSIARGLSAKQLGKEVVGVGRNEEILQQALEDGMITSYSTQVQEACNGADLVIIAVPGLTVERILEEMKPVISQDMVITDAASVKGSIVKGLKNIFKTIPENFVPAHPIAGSEHSGYSASSVNLFQNKKVILTPLEATSPQATELVKLLWESLEAEVISMSVTHHDAVLAATSHLPHLLAYALVDTLSQQGESEEIFRYAAGGFRDFTRIASSDPQMWHDIFMTNSEATVEVLDKYMADLTHLRTAVLTHDSAELKATFTRAKKTRDKFLKMFAHNSQQSDEIAD